MTKVIQCTCGHEWQDGRYGKQMRVHNYAPKGYGGNPGWRCVVCLNMKPASK